MKRHGIAALVVSVVVVALAGIAAQSHLGHIRGVVKDSAGAVLSGVSVRLSREAAADRTTVTDAKGDFSFRGLAPGRYSVRAAVSAFTPATVWSDVQPGRTITLALALAAARVAESVPGAASRQAQAKTADMSPAFARGVVGGAGGNAGGIASSLAAPPAVFNTEAYDRIIDNQWTEAAHKPLSTFATGVDTASYSSRISKFQIPNS